jgi:hypothetical protein
VTRTTTYGWRTISPTPPNCRLRAGLYASNPK